MPTGWTNELTETTTNDWPLESAGQRWELRSKQAELLAGMIPKKICFDRDSPYHRPTSAVKLHICCFRLSFYRSVEYRISSRLQVPGRKVGYSARRRCVTENDLEMTPSISHVRFLKRERYNVRFALGSGSAVVSWSVQIMAFSTGQQFNPSCSLKHVRLSFTHVDRETYRKREGNLSRRDVRLGGGALQWWGPSEAAIQETWLASLAICFPSLPALISVSCRCLDLASMALNLLFLPETAAMSVCRVIKCALYIF